MNLCKCGCGKDVLKEKNIYINGHNKPFLGKRISKIHKEKIKKALTGRRLSKEHRSNLSKSHKDPSLEVRKKISIGTKRGLINKGYTPDVISKLTKEAMKNFSGENSPHWKGGIAYEPYCQLWGDIEYKNDLKNRDNHQCQNPYCGITRMLSLKVYSQDLHLHHINYTKKDCNPKNILSVCCRCNSKSNFNREIWQFLYSWITISRDFNVKLILPNTFEELLEA